MYRITTYNLSNNIGDAIQTIALSRLFPICVGVSRDRLAEGAHKELLYVVNGWHRQRDEIPRDDPFCFFAGVHCSTEHLPWIRQSGFPIGARDPFTHQMLQQHGLESRLIGCASLTFEPFFGLRDGVFSVDYPPGPGTQLSHWRPYTSFLDQWDAGLKLLAVYQRATAVYTSRLHVVLPCLAFGTPVAFFPSTFQTERYSLLNHLGLEPGRLCQLDMTSVRNGYLDFVGSVLPDVRSGAPQFPLASPCIAP